MNALILLATGALSASLTYRVSVKLKQGRVRASALLSLLVGLFFHLFPNVLNGQLTHQIPLVFIGSSFIGMVSAKLKMCYFWLAVAGSLFSTLFIYKDDFFQGFGGELGALAFISLLVTLLFSRMVSKLKETKKTSK